MQLPGELVSMVRERRIIPFVGAGFSSGLGVPGWEGTLSLLADQTEGSLPAAELLRYTGGDLLQAAEYLFLKCDRHIGPIRHALEQAVGGVHSSVLSSVHVELVNLGAPQVYTTNYDDLLESTYRLLGLPFTTVVLPKDVALADTERTQIVKYHGDLRHESTLVLTESSYYKRLDFESPMDLKFRSDLLGRSVLFMGYSFRDVNIRVIWFKLMEMMRDIPEADRRPSYIVRTEPNPVLEDLYHAVGLKTIVLQDGSDELRAEERTRLLGEFLMRLGEEASPQTIPGQGSPRFLSTAALADARDQLVTFAERFPKGRLGTQPFFEPIHAGLGAVDRLVRYRVPPGLGQDAMDVINNALSLGLVSPSGEAGIAQILRRFGPSNEVTRYVVRLLMSPGGHLSQRHLLLGDDTIDWGTVWAGVIPQEDVEALGSRFRDELNYFLSEGYDEDLAFVIDAAKRVVLGQIFASQVEGAKGIDRLKKLLGEVSKIIPGVPEYDPDPAGPPHVDVLVEQIEVFGAQREGSGRRPGAPIPAIRIRAGPGPVARRAASRQRRRGPPAAK
jgi:hypothetical protein